MSETTPYRKQEQEPATDEITEVAPGILRLQLPVSLPGLGHVNCYAIEDERGVALVDPGLPDADSFDALVARLADAGYELRHVHTAIVTHSHMDHFGGVHRLRQETDADMLSHASFRRTMRRSEARETLDVEALELTTEADYERLQDALRSTTPWGTSHAPPIEALKRMAAMGREGMIQFRLPEPSITVDDSQVVTLGRREWVAVHTPGHTEDHLCLWDPAEGVMLSGDHVLPTITPHIGGMTEQADPLAAFFESLERMATFPGVSVVLPAHGHPFHDLAGRAEHIREHHLERLDVIREAAAELGTGTVDDFMRRLFRERSWGDMAASETYAHLEHLRILGEAVVSEQAGQKVFTLSG